MTFRSVIFTTDRSVSSGRQFSLPGGGLASEIFLTKMTTIFDRNPAISAEVDIAKRVYSINEGKLTSYNHFVPGKITCQVKVFNHTRMGVTSTSTDDEINEDDLDALQEAAALERETFNAIKASFQQMQTIVKYRLDMETNVINEPTVFERALNKIKVAEMSQEEDVSNEPTAGQISGSDYLTPFLRNLKDPNKITREEAMDIRQTCLDSLKARLVERANIIQNRLNEENSKLARKQEQFQRAQRDGEMLSDEYEKYCTEAMFRIHILEQRLVAHEETALKKFADIDAKLAADPRLKVLKAHS